jgi:hypothetical protein
LKPNLNPFLYFSSPMLDLSITVKLDILGSDRTGRSARRRNKK